MNHGQKDEMARRLGIPPDEQQVLDAGMSHPRACRCETCRQWWKLMGADPDTGRYGPFTREEVEAAEPLPPVVRAREETA